MKRFEGVGLGIVGTGSVALDHASAAVSLGASIIGGVCTSINSPNWKNFSARFPTCTYFQDPNELLNHPSVDALVLCLPWKAQVQECWIKWAFSQKKPILLEKPVSLDAGKLRRAIECHSKNVGNKLVAYNRRYYKVFEVLLERLNRGGLRAADLTFSEDVVRLASRGGPETALYSLEYSSCHMLDAAICLFGDLSVVHMTAYHQEVKGIKFINYNGLLANKRGIPVALFSNADDPCAVGIRCKFDDGTTWCLAPNEVLTVYSSVLPKDQHGFADTLNGECAIVSRQVEAADIRPGFQAQMAAFLSGEFGHGCRVDHALKLLDLVASIKSKAVIVSE